MLQISEKSESSQSNSIYDRDDNLFFISTQMQVRHEEVVEKERNEKSKRESISQLQRFKNESSITPTPSLTTKSPAPEPKSKSKSKSRSNTRATSKSTGRSKKKKNISMSSMVRETFSNDKLAYFSGDQTKIDDFLTKMNNIDNLNELQAARTSSLFSKSEWIYILKNIKLKFPDLSSKNKKNLKYILKKINKIEREKNQQQSVWSQASTHPEIELTNDDLKWLYDLDDEQMINNTTIEEDLTNINDNDDYDENPFVITLSQLMKINKRNDHGIIASTNGAEMISDSESEPELLGLSIKYKSNEALSVQVKNTTSNDHELSSHQKESVYETIESDQSLCFTDTIPKHVEQHLNNQEEEEVEEVDVNSNFELENCFGQSANISQSNFDEIFLPIEISSSPKERTDIPVRQTGEVFSSFDHPYEVIVSSPHNPISPTKDTISLKFKEQSPFKTPTKKSKNLLELVSSTLQRSSKRSTPRFQLSPLRSTQQSEHEEIIVSSSDESVHSTTKSKSNHSLVQSPHKLVDKDESPKILLSHIPQRPQNIRKRKLFHTTRLEIRSDLNIKDFEDFEKKISIRKVGSRNLRVDSDIEIEDSEDEDNSDDQNLSIVEITREIDNTDNLINLGRESPNNREENTSVLQVPSSPTPKDTGNDILKLSSSQSIGAVFSSENVKKVNNQLPICKSPSGGPEMEDFNILTTKQLKEKFQEWGLKPVKGRSRMIQILTETSKLINHSHLKSSTKSQDVSENNSQLAVKISIFKRLTETLKLNQYWFDKIISFEPIVLDQLQNWLESDSVGIRLDRNLLERYCDELGISYTAGR